jgi:hypothetical protein
MINRFVIIIFILCCNSPIVFSQSEKLTPRITKESLDKVNEDRTIQAFLLTNQLKSDESISILAGLIPKIVEKERKIRHLWDKRKERSQGKKPIYVFNRLIEYDSVDFTTMGVYDFRSSKSDAINEKIALCNDCPGKESFSKSYHRNLPCIDTFPFVFYFVDDIYKADFVLSTIGHSISNPFGNVYVWHIRGFSIVESYLLKLELPWFNECYNVLIDDLFVTDYKFSMDTLNELFEILSER